MVSIWDAHLVIEMSQKRQKTSSTEAQEFWTKIDTAYVIVVTSERFPEGSTKYESALPLNEPGMVNTYRFNRCACDFVDTL